MITLDMVRAGYELGIINLINGSAVYGDGVVCSIGDNWFYFGGYTAESYDSPDEYKKDFPAEEIITDIFNVLEDFSSCGAKEFKDEYLYYEAHLKESIYEAMNGNIDYSNLSTEAVKELEKFAYENYYTLATKPITNPSKDELVELEKATYSWEKVSNELKNRKQTLNEQIRSASLRTLSDVESNLAQNKDAER